MTKGKRQKQRDRRHAARRQKQHGNQPTPAIVAIREQVQPPAKAQTATGPSDQQGGAQDPRESPVGSQRSRVDWQLVIAITEALVSVCLLIFAAVGAWVAKGQLSAMREQNDAMIAQNKLIVAQLAQTEESINYLELEHRPWVGITGHLSEPSAGHLVGDFEIHNYGNIPALINRITMNGFQEKKPVDEERLLNRHESEQPINFNSIVPPDETIGMPRQYLFVNKKLLDNFDANESLLIVIATIEYSSANGRKARLTRRCWIYDPETKDLAEYHQHNYMD